MKTDTRLPRRTKAPLSERFTRHVEKGHAPSDCWLWTGYTLPNGYGWMSLGREHAFRKEYAHRVSYELYHGVALRRGVRGDVLDHLCRNRACVNPEHLEIVTTKQNILRSPVAVAAVNARKRLCKRGHEFTTENTIKTAHGRACRKCRSEVHWRKASLQRQFQRAVAKKEAACLPISA